MDLFSGIYSIILIILLGFFCCQKNIFNKNQIEAFQELIFKIILPVYLFLITYNQDLALLFNLEFISAYFITFLCLISVMLFFLIKQASSSNTLIKLLASSYINSSIFTVPVMNILLKDVAAAVIVNIMQVVIIQPIFVFALNMVEPHRKSTYRQILTIITNPIVILPFTGILLNLFNIAVPDIVINSLNKLSVGAPGIALFCYGMTIGSLRLSKEFLKFDLLIIALGKNIFHPIIACIVAYYLNLADYWFYALIIIGLSPPAYVVYLIAKKFNIEEELIKKHIALSAVISFLILVLFTIFIKYPV